MNYIINQSKLKSVIKDKFGIDLTGRIKIDPSLYKILNDFDECTDYNALNYRRNSDKYGPMYLIDMGNGIKVLYQVNYITDLPWILTNHCDSYGESDFMDYLGIRVLGLT